LARCPARRARRNAKPPFRPSARRSTCSPSRDRHGCAVGAAIALTLDWRTIRVLLDISAQRLDLSPPTCTLPDLRETARLAAAVGTTPAVERAMVFGAQQLITQHSGLWDLLEARAEARIEGFV
jgi:hypothetical protein